MNNYKSNDSLIYHKDNTEDIESSFNKGLSLGVKLGSVNGKKIYQYTNDRYCHTAILGQTGSGKSNLVHQMEREDILSGAGVAIFASHEEDALYPLNCVPQDRLDDVVLIDATDPEYAPCLNPFGIDRSNKLLISKAIERVIDLIVQDNHAEWVGPRFTQMARASMKLIIEGSHSIPHLGMIKECFESPETPKKLLSNCTDKSVFNFWTKIVPSDAQSDEWGEVTAWFISKFQQFVDNNVLSRLFRPGLKSVDFKDIVDNDKILIVYAPATEIGEEASRIVKKYIIMELREAIMSRGSSDNFGLVARRYAKKPEINPFYIYIDEFGEVASVEYSKLFAQVRKRNVGCIVSFQNLSQLRVIDPQSRNYSNSLIESLLANVGTFISFSVNPLDAKLLGQRFNTSSSLLRKPKKFSADAFIRSDGDTIGPYLLSVPLEPEARDIGNPDIIYDNLIRNRIIYQLTNN